MKNVGVPTASGSDDPSQHAMLVHTTAPDLDANVRKLVHRRRVQKRACFVTTLIGHYGRALPCMRGGKQTKGKKELKYSTFFVIRGSKIVDSTIGFCRQLDQFSCVVSYRSGMYRIVSIFEDALLDVTHIRKSIHMFVG